MNVQATVGVLRTTVAAPLHVTTTHEATRRRVDGVDRQLLVVRPAPAVFTMDDWNRLDGDQRDRLKCWADQYIDADPCFGFELATDGPAIAARFKIWDLYQRPPVWHTVDVFDVEPCPWPFTESSE